MTYDVAIVGGGIVGLATAYRLLEAYPEKRTIVLEKEPTIAAHQTGRNSGVIHSGVYYKPGSLKAENCREGKRALIDFCERHGIAYEMCGKVIVAVAESERPGLHRIYERGQQNNVACELIGRERLQEFEPHTAGIEAIHVPEAGIVDYKGVCARFAELLQEAGHEVRTRAEVRAMHAQNGSVTLETNGPDVRARYVINCAGLYSDRVAAMSGQEPSVQILPFRGEYFKLRPEAEHLCRTLIYPVPDPAFPFLGVHFTKMVLGGVECGPNAVLAFAREGYNFSDVNLAELAETLSYPGFVRLAAKHWKTGLGEMWRSLSKRAFVRSLQRLIPAIREEDLEKVPAGVRAQAVTPDGNLVDDFLIEETERVVNVCNAASPAATASLNVGRLIAERLAVRF